MDFGCCCFVVRFISQQKNCKVKCRYIYAKYYCVSHDSKYKCIYTSKLDNN